MIDRDTARHYTLEKCLWNREAREALRPTFHDDGSMIARGVESGRMELWHVNQESWCVTEVRGDMLFLWCYQGRQVIQFVLRMLSVAREMKLSEVSFFSHHKGALRAWRHRAPVVLPTQTPGESQIILRVDP